MRVAFVLRSAEVQPLFLDLYVIAKAHLQQQLIVPFCFPSNLLPLFASECTLNIIYIFIYYKLYAYLYIHLSSFVCVHDTTGGLFVLRTLPFSFYSLTNISGLPTFTNNTHRNTKHTHTDRHTHFSPIHPGYPHSQHSEHRTHFSPIHPGYPYSHKTTTHTQHTLNTQHTHNTTHTTHKTLFSPIHPGSTPCPPTTCSYNHTELQHQHITTQHQHTPPQHNNHNTITLQTQTHILINRQRTAVCGLKKQVL